MTLDLVSLAGIVAVLAAPGPTNALLAAAGAARAPIGAVRAIGAVLSGYLVAVAVLRLVGAPIGAALPVLVPLVKIALAGWLAVIGFGLWRHDPDAGSSGPIDARHLFGTTLLNPKAAIFAFGFFPAATDAPTLAVWFGCLAVAVAGSAGLWWSLGRLARPQTVGGTRLVPKIASLVLVGFGLALAGTTLAAAG
jgi:threonine/homoserine/homoserine lactone efflux protein